MKDQLKIPVQNVLTLLVGEKYADLENLTRGVRLSAEAMAKAISDYGEKLVLLPEDGFRLMDVVEVKDSQPKRWSIAMPLWTQKEGRSDLTLEMTVIEKQNGFTIELDDLHVL